MSSLLTFPRLRASVPAIALAALAGLAACESEDPVTDVTAQLPVLNILVPTSPTAVLPGGTSELIGTRISGFDTSVPDAFGRATGSLGNYKQLTTSCSSCGPGFGFDMAPGVRNSSEDPRAPALEPSDGGAGAFLALFNPAWTGLESQVGPGWWDLFGELVGLKPETVYTIALARMALVPRGELDQHRRLTGADVAQPDSLYFLGGAPYTPGSTINCAFEAGVGVNSTRNPVVLGIATTDANGNVTVDCLPVSTGDSPWWRTGSEETPAGAADSLPFGANSAGALQPGQYNYVLVYEGEYVPGSNQLPAARPTLRIQVGPDIDANGNTINNGFAPFPAGITDLSNFKNLPGGANAVAVPGSIALSLSGLPTLGSRQYAVWLHNRETNAYAPAAAKINGGAPSPTFDSPGEAEALTLVLDDESGVDFAQFHSVVLSIESGAAGSPSANSQFLFSEYLTPSEALADGPLTLGAFDPAQPRRFTVAGSGAASFFADSLLVDLRRVPAPPAGFHYQSFLVRMRGPNVEASQRLHAVTLDELGNGTDRLGEGEVGDFRNYNTYILALEPDGVTSLTAAQILVSENYADKFPTVFRQEQ